MNTFDLSVMAIAAGFTGGSYLYALIARKKLRQAQALDALKSDEAEQAKQVPVNVALAEPVIATVPHGRVVVGAVAKAAMMQRSRVGITSLQIAAAKARARHHA